MRPRGIHRFCATLRTASSGILLLAILLIAAGFIGEARADRVFGDDILVSGEPVGVDLHGTHSSGQHTVLAFGDTVVITWYGTGPEGAGAYVSRSLDGGSTFEAPVRANDVSVGCSGASLAADGYGNICSHICCF